MDYWYHLLLFGTCFLILPFSAEMKATRPKRIILDIDVGSDDAFALLALLDAEKSGSVKIEAIVCSMGNAELHHVCRNVVRILELLQRTDIPVYKGATGPLMAPKGDLDHFYGQDGLGDLEYDSDPNLSIIKKDSAIKAIHDIVMGNPKEITIFCCGPVTNAALAMKVYDGVANNIKDMIIMGGNYLGIGNVRDMAEFNFFVDPESARTILEDAKFPITILPWEACMYVPITLDWRFNELGKYNQSSVMQLLNRAETKIFSDKDSSHGWVTCDVFTALAALYPKDVVLDKQKYKLTVETCGENTRGQVIVRRKENNEKSNITVIQEVNFDKIKDILINIVQRLV